jgi:MoaD family protein
VRVQVHFYSYFKELSGCEATEAELPSGGTIQDLLTQLYGRFPKLAGMGRSTLIAVGVDYQGRHYVLKDGDEVSLFPPVQGG